jgi:hypothetical protein
MKRRFFFQLALILIAISLFGSQAEARPSLYSRAGAIEAAMGLGFTFNTPIKFDLKFDGEYFWHNNISLGVDLDILIRSSTTFIVRPFGRYHFDIARYPRFVPYVGGGLGAGGNTAGGGIMDIMIPNFGFKYALTKNWYVGPDMGFHILTNFDNTTPDFHLLGIISYRF